MKMERSRPHGFRLGYILEVKLRVCTDGLYVGKMEELIDFFTPVIGWIDDCVIC